MASGAWSVLRTTGDAPTPRGGHTSTLVEKNLLLMGGVVGAKAGTFEYFPLDPLVLNTETLAWFRPRVALGKGPIPRAYHTATRVGSSLYVVGGQCSPKSMGCYTGVLGDMPVFDLVQMSWGTKDTRGKPPSARYWHTAALLEGKLIIVGGFDGKKARAPRNSAQLCPPRNFGAIPSAAPSAARASHRLRRRPPARSRSATSSSLTSRRTCGTRRGAAARWRRRCARTRAPRWASGSSSSAGAR